MKSIKKIMGFIALGGADWGAITDLSGHFPSISADQVLGGAISGVSPSIGADSAQNGGPSRI
jgi:hypothetical protein